MAGYAWSDDELEDLLLPFDEFAKAHDRTWNSYRHKCAELGFPARRASSRIGDASLVDEVARLLRGGSPVDRFTVCERLDITPAQLETILTELVEERGLLVEDVHQRLLIPALAPARPPLIQRIEAKDRELIRLGIIADTHLNSTAYQSEALHWLYDRFAAEGVSIVLHAGDLTAGERVYRGQLYEVERVGFERQRQFVVDEYPLRPGIKTFLIGGNHDEDYLKHGGIDFVRAVERERSDFVHLGWYSAVALIGDLKVELWHGYGGGAYAVSYPTQKAIDAMSGGMKPDLLVVGHYHNVLELNHRNVYAIHPGSTEGPTLYTKRRRLQTKLGGFLVEVEMEPTDARPGYEHTVRAVKTQFFQFYLDEQGRAV